MIDVVMVFAEDRGTRRILKDSINLIPVKLKRGIPYQIIYEK